MKLKRRRPFSIAAICVIARFLLGTVVVWAQPPVIPQDAVAHIRSRVTNSITPGIVVVVADSAFAACVVEVRERLGGDKTHGQAPNEVEELLM